MTTRPLVYRTTH